jgi:uncharacterized protein YeaO (DUF488 family)
MCERIHEPVSPDDGDRVLIDRIWPRGISRERARDGAVTIGFAARDARHSNAAVLAEVLGGR